MALPTRFHRRTSPSTVILRNSPNSNSEIVGALPEGEWITRTPSMIRKLALIAKVQDEVGHGQHHRCRTDCIGHHVPLLRVVQYAAGQFLRADKMPVNTLLRRMSKPI